MFGRLLFFLVFAVPLIEIGLFIVIGQAIGLVPTLLGVLISAIAGALLIRWQGLAVLRDMQATVQRGEVPGRQIADAMLIGLGGLLLIVPGYFTDAVGLLLLIPPLRGLLYRALASRVRVVSEPSVPPADPQLVELDPGNWRDR
jgi:UPF0716 protein FxsA